MYGLTPEQCKLLMDTLAKYREDIAEARIFGSRARGDYTKISDIDLAVSFLRPVLPELVETMENSLLPYKVDIIDINAAKNEKLTENISRDGKLLFRTEKGVIMMTVEQIKMKLEEYEKAVAKLQAALKKDVNADDVYLDGVIQRFEFCFELAWKMMKAYLAYDGIEANSPRASIREGFAAGLIPNAEAWLDMLEKRNLSSHTYDEKTALDIYEHIKNDYAQMLTALREDMHARLEKK